MQPAEKAALELQRLSTAHSSDRLFHRAFGVENADVIASTFLTVRFRS